MVRKLTTGLTIAYLLMGQAADAVAPKPTPPTNEARTAATLDRIAASPPRLRIFLQSMPKGADLHNHGGGVIYVEDYLRWAGAAGLCLSTDTYAIVAPPCDVPNRIPAATLTHDYPHYSGAIDALSTRGFEAGVGDPRVSGYDRFFATFAAFSKASRFNEGKELSATRSQAAADRVAYVEQSNGARQASDLAAQVAGLDPYDFEALSARLAPLLPDAVKQARADYDHIDADANAIDGCATSAPKPACQVVVRHLYQAIRTNPPAQVYAQLALGFALVEADPRFVGVNIAAPEHDPIALQDYALHMRMIAFLKAKHPGVHLSLHAGELTLGLVPPRELSFHISDAIEIAGARRIGHGIDISYESNATQLLQEMAEKRIAVEINLTSNAVILGVKGAAHPLSLYREAGVPVVLSTDDEGVSRSDMTNEYVRAVMEQHLRYADLKQIVRDGLQYSFLEGASLWKDRAGGAKVAVCVTSDSAACRAFLAVNLKAAQQEQLERDLAAFEAMKH
jgi:adenosine deaminase